MRTVDDPSLADLYRTADTWSRSVLAQRGSLFEPGNGIWTPANFEELKRRYVEQGDGSSRSFGVKLEEQLRGSPPGVIQLMGELLFVHFLVAHSVSGRRKREVIEHVLGLAASPVRIPRSLDAVLDLGVCSAGMSFNSHRYWHLVQLLRFAADWVGLGEIEKDRLLANPWAFKDFVMAPVRHVERARAQRLALLHLVHPRHFEPIVAPSVKAAIAEHYAELVPEGVTDVDRQITAIRQALAGELGPTFSFFQEGVMEQWSRPKGRPKRRRARRDVVAETAALGSPSELALEELEDALFLDEGGLVQLRQLLLERGQLILHGPPGTGKTFVARRLAEHIAGPGGSVELLQFHPSYAYEDFVEGYRPRADAGQVRYELVEGPLKRMAARARQSPEATHVLVIDEINRGNLASLMGELFFLLEYRDAEIRLQYSDEPFSLPRNLLILGTMNTADRSIALVDLALRRRFYFVGFFPGEEPIEGLLRRWLAEHAPSMGWVADVVDLANRRLQSRDTAIGPSYFLRKGLDEEMLERIWEHAVLPYLAEQVAGGEEAARADYDLDSLRDAVEEARGYGGDRDDA